MKIQTLEYNANQPAPQLVTVPLASKYAIGVKVKKDGEYVDCDMDEMTVDGLSATSQVAGYNVYELSSDAIAATKQLDVEVNAPATVQDAVSANVSGTAGGGSILKAFTFVLSSNEELPERFTVKPSDLSYDFDATATLNGEPVEITYNESPHPRKDITRNGATYASCSYG